jgi:hypothetical protein
MLDNAHSASSRTSIVCSTGDAQPLTRRRRGHEHVLAVATLLKPEARGEDGEEQQRGQGHYGEQRDDQHQHQAITSSARIPSASRAAFSSGRIVVCGACQKIDGRHGATRNTGFS